MNLGTLGHRGHKYPLMSYSSDFKEAPESVCPSTAETTSCHSRSFTAAASEAQVPCLLWTSTVWLMNHSDIQPRAKVQCVIETLVLFLWLSKIQK